MNVNVFKGEPFILIVRVINDLPTLLEAIQIYFTPWKMGGGRLKACIRLLTNLYKQGEVGGWGLKLPENV